MCVCCAQLLSGVQLCDPMDCMQPTRLLCPWDFPGKSPGVGCHRLLQAPTLVKSIFYTAAAMTGTIKLIKLIIFGKLLREVPDTESTSFVKQNKIKSPFNSHKDSEWVLLIPSFSRNQGIAK